MNKEERDLLEQKIRAAIKASRHDITALRELAQPILPGKSRTTNESLNENTDTTCAENIRDVQEKLSGLERILKQLHKPEFGLCAMCEEPIPLARIILRPESKKCIRCATRLASF